MNTYMVRAIPHGKAAKTKCVCRSTTHGETATDRAAGSRVVLVQARDNNDLRLRVLPSVLWTDDKRPVQLSGYAKPYVPKVGQRVQILARFTVGYGEDGNPVYADRGTISEVVSAGVVSVHPDGYHNNYVDFTAREIALL